MTDSSLTIQKRNFRYVQIDAVGVAIAAAALPFLPVFLTRLGASNFQVGLLTVMPGVTGLVLALVAGRFLQTRRNIVPWYSLARLLVIACILLSGLLTLVVPPQAAVLAVLGIWALATLPQTTLAVAFSVVMNAVAGPDGRFALLSRRWSIFGLTSFLTTLAATQLLDRVAFPLNYQLTFSVLSLGGLLSYYFSRRIDLPEQAPPVKRAGGSPLTGLRETLALVRDHPAFASFAGKRFIYLAGITLSAPIFPLYFVRIVRASDAQIGMINMTATLVMMFGYFLWTWLSRRRGRRLVLLTTTFGLVLYPALTALTDSVGWIVVYAGVAGLFQSGADLVFFDELMRTVPPEYSATFVSLAQSLQYLAAVIAPLAGTWLAGYVGLGGALLASAGLRLLGFLLFLLPVRRPTAA